MLAFSTVPEEAREEVFGARRSRERHESGRAAGCGVASIDASIATGGLRDDLPRGQGSQPKHA
jgi:hypothetical protein